MAASRPPFPAPSLQQARRRALAAGALLAVSCIAAAAGTDCVAPEPSHYRLSAFRAPTPCTLAGATVLGTDALAWLVAEGSPVLIDVLPSPRRPPGLGNDALWLPPRRDNIPGSVWLPNTGFGVLPVEEERYLRDNLARLTAGDAARALVFYCERACWMSWNAARRAVAWGYRAVFWYPGGTDDWKAAGHPLAATLPTPRGSGH